jgi:SAM-dependent methyltransferase
MKFNEIKQYWNNRALNDSSRQSTTNDVYLREIEFLSLKEQIQHCRPCKVADLGCGDGWTTFRLASEFPDIQFFASDYSSAMIDNALKKNNRNNISYACNDICEGINGKYDLIYTTRVLINIPDWEMQKIAINNICAALENQRSIYVMIENFIEGHNAFNEIRKLYGLNEIPIRDFNFPFSQKILLEYIEPYFDIIFQQNISSSYYLMSRIVYSKVCADNGEQPDYFSPYHKYAAQLPFCGDFGPTKLLCLSKKKTVFPL